MNEGNSYEGKYFKLTRDIDLAGKEWTPIGIISRDAERVNPFSGTFDGKGCLISNLKVDKHDESFVGLFGASDGVIRNVNLIGAEITGKDYVGTLVGYSRGIVSDCSSIGDVKGSDSTGGLIGFIEGGGGSVVKSVFKGSVKGNDNVGGLVGYIERGGDVSDCASEGGVSGREQVGGLVGHADIRDANSLSNCESKSDVEGQKEVGGLVGENSSDINSCEAKGNVRGEEGVGGLVG